MVKRLTICQSYKFLAYLGLITCNIAILFGAASASQAEAGDGKFPLFMPHYQPTHEEAYVCTPVKLSDDQTYYVTGFAPNTTKHTAHHMLLYGCENPGALDMVYNCGEMELNDAGMINRTPCHGDSQILYAWAHDAPSLSLPEGVGYKVGKDTKIKYLVLQVHYGSIDHIPEEGDASGLELSFTSVPQPKMAGVILLGTGGYIPAHTTTFFESACEIEDERTIHPFAFRVHTHSLGKVVSGWRVRDRSHWSLIGKKNPQQPQMFYPTDDQDMTLKKGDIIASRCTMVNSRDRTTYIGSTNNDEMCNFYVMYWVEGDGEPVAPHECVTPGPPFWSWGGYQFGAGLTNIPEEAASTI